MRELSCQIRHHTLLPFSAEDKEVLSDFHDNQVVRVKLYATIKKRSLIQLRKYWATCTKTSGNTDDPQWNTKEKVDFQCRVSLHFVDDTVIAVRPDGTVTFKYRSIAFANLKHILACNYINRAYEIQAAKIGVTVKKLLEYVKD